MSNIKLVACDLDDTLLAPDLTISPRNREAILRVTRLGVRFILSSGRNIHSMDAYAVLLGLKDAEDRMICSNGAEILRNSDGRVLYRNPIPAELCTEIADELDRAGLAWQVYHDGKIFVSRRNDWSDVDTKLTGQPNELVQDREMLFSAGQLKFVVPGDPGLLAKTVPRLAERFRNRASILISKPYFLEILEARSDKGFALERLAGMLGVRREDVMAIGDAHNDLGMISWAGTGCAVGNAREDVKAAARLIAPVSHDEGAVAWLLDRVFGAI